MIPESERAMYAITLRQLAPHMKNWFEHYAVKHDVLYHQVYLVGRYRAGMDMNDPKSVILELREFSNVKPAEGIPTKAGESGSSEETLLQQMFPVFQAEIESTAKEWKVQIPDVFLMVCYKKGKENEQIEDSVDLQLRCAVNKKSGDATERDRRNRLGKRIE